MKADFPVDGHPAGTELAPLFHPVAGTSAQGIYQMSLGEPILALSQSTLVVSVKDKRGNESRLDRTFSVQAPGAPVGALRLGFALVLGALAVAAGAFRQRR